MDNKYKTVVIIELKLTKQNEQVAKMDQLHSSPFQSHQSKIQAKLFFFLYKVMFPLTMPKNPDKPQETEMITQH